MDKVIDVRGLSCPQPVMLTRQALEKAGGGPVTVLVDTMTQVNNCTRAAEGAGWRVTCEEKEGEYVLTMCK
jgi:TusA-related sulfurtransferase